MIAAAVLSAAALLHGGDFSAAAHAYETQWRADHDADAAFALTQLALYDNRIADAQHWLQIARAAAPNDARAARDQTLIELRSDPAIDRVTAHNGPAIVPFVQTDPLPMVSVDVDGHDAYFLIDTGAPNIVIDASFAQQLGLSVSGSHEGTFAGGQHATVQQTMVPSLGLGSWTVSNVPAIVMPVGNMLGKDRTIGGILGTALFAHFLTTLDYRAGQLVLRDAGDSEQFESQAQGSGATIVPMWLVGDHFIFVHAKAGSGPDGLFNVDTGGTFGVQLTQAAIEAAGITLDSNDTHTGMGGGGVTTFVPFTTSVTLGGLTKTNLSGIYTPQGSQYGIFPFDVTGTISHGFFTGTALTFDFRAMRLIVLSP
jgi:hypothetical protein